jgi:hypothetical protein
MTECNQSWFEFEAHFSRRLEAEFSDGRRDPDARLVGKNTLNRLQLTRAGSMPNYTVRPFGRTKWVGERGTQSNLAERAR